MYMGHSTYYRIEQAIIYANRPIDHWKWIETVFSEHEAHETWKMYKSDFKIRVIEVKERELEFL